MLSKEYKKLIKYYKIALQKSTIQSIKILDNNMAYFITYLRYLRDYYILTTDVQVQNSDSRLLSLCYAIHEFELSVMCIDNYFTLQDNMLVPKNTTLTHALTKELYKAEKQKHLDNFWNTVNLYIGEWALNNEDKF